MTGIRLKRQTDPRWVSLYHAAALFCAAPTTALIYSARARAAGLLVDLAETGEVVTKVGARIEGLPDLSDPHALEATRQSLFLVSLAEMVVSDWQNIKDDDGVDIPFDATLLAQLFANPEVADAFSGGYLAETSAVAAEGNV